MSFWLFLYFSSYLPSSVQGKGEVFINIRIYIYIYTPDSWNWSYSWGNHNHIDLCTFHQFTKTLGICQHVEISAFLNCLRWKTSSDYHIIRKVDFLLSSEFYGQWLSKEKEENIVTYLCTWKQEYARVRF